MHGSLLLHSGPPSAPAIHQGVACIIPTVGRNMPPKTIAPSCKSMVTPAPWAGARKPLRQRQGRELHEDTEGRSRVSDGIRNLRGRHSRPSPLHRRGLQHPQTPLRARLYEPRAIRGSPRPETCQKRRLKLSTIRGALHWNGLLVGDMSQPRGGPLLSEHTSHQIGLDVDIWFAPMPDHAQSREEREFGPGTDVVAPDLRDVDPKLWTHRHTALIRT